MLKINVKKKFPHKILQIQCEVGQEIVAVVGPSGVGKTSLLHMIAGIVSPDEGDIQLNETSFTKDGKQCISMQEREIGYVFQDYALFPHKTVWENIAFSMKDEELTREWIHTLHMEDLLGKYPREISGGEKQRTALLRAYAMKPQILLLDEPFSALDEGTKETSYTQLRNLHDDWKIPVLLVTHNMQEVERIADRVYQLGKEGMVQL